MKKMNEYLKNTDGKMRVKFFWLASIIISIVLTIVLNVVLNVIL
jgi:hypothetical protein